MKPLKSDDEVVEAALVKLMGFKARSDAAMRACGHSAFRGHWFHEACPNPDPPRYFNSAQLAAHFGFRCTDCGLWFCERCEAVYRK